jgi:hypothetical protein
VGFTLYMVRSKPDQPVKPGHTKPYLKAATGWFVGGYRPQNPFIFLCRRRRRRRRRGALLRVHPSRGQTHATACSGASSVATPSAGPPTPPPTLVPMPTPVGRRAPQSSSMVPESTSARCSAQHSLSSPARRRFFARLGAAGSWCCGRRPASLSDLACQFLCFLSPVSFCCSPLKMAT